MRRGRAPSSGNWVRALGGRPEVDQLFREILPDACRRKTKKPDSPIKQRKQQEDSMAQRRTLVEGLKTPAPPVDPKKEKEFVFGQKAEAKPEHPPARQPTRNQPAALAPARVPLSTRMRGDFAEALKTASLERQLKKIEPNTLQTSWKRRSSPGSQARLPDINQL